ncbi:MAG TPA: pyridoxamine 5'-phosphate oxidase family protein [Longimicrobiales bacterium]|nr:pyridoxamine 5'-phosphate oxidase family protein [Longimicrobiales bacterium]
MSRRPKFRAMKRDEVEAVLSRNSVARLAYLLDGKVDIEPIHYVFADRTIYGRTAPGTKLNALGRDYWVAVEVDEVDAMFDWRSVVVHGSFHRIPPDQPGTQQVLWQRAVDALRGLIPEALTVDDPTPHRTVIFRIPIQKATGRTASSGASS